MLTVTVETNQILIQIGLVVVRSKWAMSIRNIYTNTVTKEILNLSGWLGPWLIRIVKLINYSVSN